MFDMEGTYESEFEEEYVKCTRGQKLNTLQFVIERCSEEGLPALKHELYGWATKRWGCQWRKYLEYITDLMLMKKIVLEGDEIWSMPRWKKIEKARKLDYNHMKDLIKNGFKNCGENE